MRVAIPCQAMMAVHRFIGMARTAGERFHRIEMFPRALLPVALLLLSVGIFACGVAYTLASHHHAHEVRTRAMRARDNVEALQSLLLGQCGVSVGPRQRARQRLRLAGPARGRGHALL